MDKETFDDIKRIAHNELPEVKLPELWRIACDLNSVLKLTISHPREWIYQLDDPATDEVWVTCLGSKPPEFLEGINSEAEWEAEDDERRKLAFKIRMQIHQTCNKMEVMKFAYGVDEREGVLRLQELSRLCCFLLDDYYFEREYAPHMHSERSSIWFRLTYLSDWLLQIVADGGEPNNIILEESIDEELEQHLSCLSKKERATQILLIMLKNEIDNVVAKLGQQEILNLIGPDVWLNNNKKPFKKLATMDLILKAESNGFYLSPIGKRVAAAFDERATNEAPN